MNVLGPWARPARPPALSVRRGVGAAEAGGGRRRAASARGLRAPLLPRIRLHLRESLCSVVPSGTRWQTRVGVLDKPLFITDSIRARSGRSSYGVPGQFPVRGISHPAPPASWGLCPLLLCCSHGEWKSSRALTETTRQGPSSGPRSWKGGVSHRCSGLLPGSRVVTA